jgi:hypothetical protein
VRTADGVDLGSLRRKGMRSIWRASYEATDPNGQTSVVIHEENPWIKVLDGLAGELPIVGMFLPMFINPAYLADRDGVSLLKMKKQPAVFEGKFTIDKLGEFADSEESLLLASLVMMILLERQRG